MQSNEHPHMLVPGAPSFPPTNNAQPPQHQLSPPFATDSPSPPPKPPKPGRLTKTHGAPAPPVLNANRPIEGFVTGGPYPNDPDEQTSRSYSNQAQSQVYQPLAVPPSLPPIQSTLQPGSYQQPEPHHQAPYASPPPHQQGQPQQQYQQQQSQQAPAYPPLNAPQPQYQQQPNYAQPGPNQGGNFNTPTRSPSLPPVGAPQFTAGQAEIRQQQQQGPPPDILFYNRHEPHYGFTNFSPHTVEYKGKVYPTSEHLFQSHKFLEHRPLLAEHIRLSSDNPRDALSEATRFKPEVRSDWMQQNIRMMDDVLYLKFTQHKSLKKELLGTGDSYLIENSPVDAFWGCGRDGKGGNQLGKGLVRLRARLRDEKQKGHFNKPA